MRAMLQRSHGDEPLRHGHKPWAHLCFQQGFLSNFRFQNLGFLKYLLSKGEKWQADNF
jgi:hypothetical protein